MDWTGQVIFQSLMVATAAIIALFFPWDVVRIFAAIFLFWFLIAIGRNPRFFLQRLVRTIVLGMMPFVVAGLSVKAFGQVALPGLGDVTFQVVQGSADALWILVAIIIACLILDGALAVLERRRRDAWFPGLVERAPLYLKQDGTSVVIKRVLVQASSNLAVGGAQLTIEGLWPRRFPCDVHVPQDPGDPELPITPGRPLRLLAGADADLRVAAKIPSGRYRSWLRFRLFTPIVRLIPLRAMVVLKAPLRGPPLAMPITLDPFAAPS